VQMFQINEVSMSALRVGAAPAPLVQCGDRGRDHGPALKQLNVVCQPCQRARLRVAVTVQKNQHFTTGVPRPEVFGSRGTLTWVRQLKTGLFEQARCFARGWYFVAGDTHAWKTLKQLFYRPIVGVIVRDNDLQAQSAGAVEARADGL